jgi:hypothetical protein
MPQVNTLNGWTGQSISHNTDLHDAAHKAITGSLTGAILGEAPTANMDTMSRQVSTPDGPAPAGLLMSTPGKVNPGGLNDPSLGSRFMDAALPQSPMSSVGGTNSAAQLPVSADQLAITPETLHDPSLGSRGTINPMTGVREAPIVASVSQMGNGNIPDMLKQSIANLNAEQTMKRAMQAELVNRIVSGVASGGPNSYLWSEALRSAAVNPGAHVQFNAAVQNPLIGEGYKQATSAYADKTAQQTQALKSANGATGDLATLQAQRARLGSTVMGANYSNSPQQQLDAKITDAYLAGSPNSATQQLARSVSGPNSGWFPALPTY